MTYWLLLPRYALYDALKLNTNSCSLLNSSSPSFTFSERFATRWSGVVALERRLHVSDG